MTSTDKNAIIVPVEEHAQRIVERVRITRAEYLLIQRLRAVRKRSLGLVDIGGDGQPKTIRVLEACFIDLMQ